MTPLGTSSNLAKHPTVERDNYDDIPRSIPQFIHKYSSTVRIMVSKTIDGSSNLSTCAKYGYRPMNRTLPTGGRDVTQRKV